MIMWSTPRAAVTAVLTLVVGFVTGDARAQSKDAEARLERLADGVYAIIHDDAIQQWPSGATGWPHGNTGVIVGHTGVMVVDSTFLPSRAKADIALIRTVTDQPVRYLVNTHWHMDHTSGNADYRDAFPGLIIVGPRESSHFIGYWQQRWPNFETAPGSATRNELADLEQQLKAGKDADGKVLDSIKTALVERAFRCLGGQTC